MHTSSYQHVAGKAMKTQNFKASPVQNKLIEKYKTLGIVHREVNLILTGNNAKTLEFKEDMLRKPGKIRQEKVKEPKVYVAKLITDKRIRVFRHRSKALLLGMLEGYIQKYPELLPCEIFIGNEKVIFQKPKV
jgi:dGTP triphosphohydrolase